MAEKKCPECPPKGLPGWMATFSDMVTLLLTFFVLLLSFAKTETAKFESALGSVRDAFGGNVLVAGEVLMAGKSPDDSPTMVESQSPIKPFPIEFLSMEGMLDKHEINRSSAEDMSAMKQDLKDFDLGPAANIYELPEGIQVRLKDKIFFDVGTIKVAAISIEIFEKMIKMLREKNWVIFVEGHAARGETSQAGLDALKLSSARAEAITRILISKGIQAERITTVAYGDARPDNKGGKESEVIKQKDSRVEFILRKVDLRYEGNKVESPP